MINELEFELMTGRKPVDDDLERVNCDRVGEIGHRMCGVCADHRKPRFECGCVEPRKPAHDLGFRH